MTMIRLRSASEKRDSVRSAFALSSLSWIGMWWAIRRALKKVNFKTSIQIWRYCFLIEIGDSISFKIRSRHDDDEFYVELSRTERGYFTQLV